MKKMSSICGIIAAIALLLGTGVAQAQSGYFNEYTYGGNTIDVFTLSPWSGAPVGSTILQNNVSWSSGTWAVPSGVLSLQVLVVGGGAGSSVWSCGAGSGGAYYTSGYTPSSGSVNIVVGAGGAGIAGGNSGNGNAAGLSSFDGMLIAYGGTLTNGYGIGGDSGGYSTDGGTTIVPGYAGGPADVSNSSGAGARNPGLQGATSHGGDGLLCGITGDTSAYYGGGGGANSSGANGGGLGGGGGGPAAIWLASLPGVDGLGGGAGGSWGGAGANGGSGIVIVAYQAAAIPEPSTLVLVGLGLLGTLVVGRRSRKSC